MEAASEIVQAFHPRAAVEEIPLHRAPTRVRVAHAHHEGDILMDDVPFQGVQPGSVPPNPNSVSGKAVGGRGRPSERSIREYKRAIDR